MSVSRKVAAVATAPPTTSITVGEIMQRSAVLDRLFDQALRDCHEARSAIVARDAATKGRLINHAHALVEELACALDPFWAPQITSQLQSLYFFAQRRLETAQLEFEAEPLDDVVLVLSTLRQAFATATAGLLARAQAERTQTLLIPDRAPD